MAEYIRVRDLNALARQVLENCEPLNNLILCGEVSNFTRTAKADTCISPSRMNSPASRPSCSATRPACWDLPRRTVLLVLAYGRRHPV